ncbi:MAG: 4-hydroxy-tetrahydrodipicolinate reductase [Vampirovibrionales bacterium]
MASHSSPAHSVAHVMPEGTRIPVVILGACGRMGREAVKTMLLHEERFHLVGLFDRNKKGACAGEVAGMPDHPSPVTVQYDLAEVLQWAKEQSKLPRQSFVVVDLTVGSSTREHITTVAQAGGLPVIGATGFTPEDIASMDTLLKTYGLEGALIPNFSIGAVLLMQFAQKASTYFSHSELIEYHHNQKLDAPSGTAVRTATLMEEARQTFAVTNITDHETMAGARGCETQGKLRIHSVRLPGLVAHQEVLFGAQGELLTLRHDSFDRACFMPGVRQVAQSLAAHLYASASSYQLQYAGLTIGLEHYL